MISRLVSIYNEKKMLIVSNEQLTYISINTILSNKRNLKNKNSRMLFSWILQLSI